MTGLGAKFRTAISQRQTQSSSINQHSVIDTKAVIAIRWLGLAGQTIALVIVAFGFGYEGAFTSAFGLVAVGAAVNLWQNWRRRCQTVTSRPELLIALSFDVLQLSGLLYLTGGMANPFAMLLLAPVVVSAALLDFRATVYLVLLVGFCAIRCCLLRGLNRALAYRRREWSHAAGRRQGAPKPQRGTIAHKQQKNKRKRDI